MKPLTLVASLAALLLAPLLVGLINRTRAFVAGRRGPPLVQPYRDVLKLLRRGAVYGDVTTPLVRLGPVVNIVTLVGTLLLLPFGTAGAAISFPGDMIVLVGLFALGRFVTVLAALDTGSSFEGMGASREVQFGALAEPALLVALATLSRATGATDLSAMYGAISVASWAHALPALGLVGVTFLMLELIENSRIPVDDPTTHLELTMIHEVMVLDHSGPDLGLIQYGAALKLWIVGALLVGLIPLRGADPWLAAGVTLFGMALLAVTIGLIESAMARYRLVTVPQFVVGAATLSVVAFIVLMV
ncbi:MAG TPA: NADH-quinone oxidoreductase subunit H [Stellaceae bacterium]|jgi:formate hydrogenlyase subunit 4|nr:NADH-quinone oxidoreductase subunit H [Stellaceae bacterium]